MEHDDLHDAAQTSFLRALSNYKPGISEGGLKAYANNIIKNGIDTHITDTHEQTGVPKLLYRKGVKKQREQASELPETSTKPTSEEIHTKIDSHSKMTPEIKQRLSAHSKPFKGEE
jgi:DNA-directed RNA polymerase specialized sigma subunit